MVAGNNDHLKVRVLIVDDIAETRENVRKLLQFENDVEVVGAGRSGREGIELAKETQPDVILMDINMPDMDGITATEIIRRSDPAVQIVILTVQVDPNYMRRAMMVGARDFLTKPPSVDELISTVRRAGRLAQEERARAAITTQVAAASGGAGGMVSVALGKVIVVYSPKGGSGCTTVAVNLAMTLHNNETRVALVDGNLQFGDVAVFLNEQCKLSIADLAPRADELDPEIVDEVMASHSRSGVKILAAPSRPEYAESVTGDRFASVLQYLTRLYSYVVVDTSSTLTDAVLAAMEIADAIILLTTQDIPAIKNARLFLDLADGLKLKRSRILFVLNRFDKRIGITAEKISENFKHEVVAVLPFEDRVVLPSINRGIPFMLEDRSKPLSRCYLSLAEVLRQRLTELAGAEVETNGQKQSVLKRLGRR